MCLVKVIHLYPMHYAAISISISVLHDVGGKHLEITKIVNIHGTDTNSELPLPPTPSYNGR